MTPPSDSLRNPIRQAADADTVVAFKDVCLSYSPPSKSALMDGNDHDYILKSLNFQLPAGSFHFLTGPSGAGKTSLLKMIYLGQKPTSGEISLFGERVKANDRAQS
eukprot:gene29808-38424_t